MMRTLEKVRSKLKLSPGPPPRGKIAVVTASSAPSAPEE
jgi:hypothetical protein